MNGAKRNYMALGRALLFPGPLSSIYVSVSRIILFALYFFWFGITNKNGSLTLANITAIMNPITEGSCGCLLTVTGWVRSRPTLPSLGRDPSWKKSSNSGFIVVGLLILPMDKL